MSPKEKERISPRTRHQIVIGFICFALFYGFCYLIPYPESLPVFLLNFPQWLIFFILWAAVVMSHSKEKLDSSRIARFLIVIVIAASIISLSPWKLVHLVAQYFSGITIFELSVFLQMLIMIICSCFGLLITLIAITETIPRHFKSFVRQTLVKCVLVTAVCLIIANIEIPIILYIPTKFSDAFLVIDAIYTMLMSSLVNYYIITSFLGKTKPFVFPKRKSERKPGNDDNSG